MSEKITMIPATEPNAYQKQQIERKFGMFVHYGINTFLNQEWSDGTADAKVYAPTGVDCEQWAKTAYEAGMQYILVITKHHDGFCMWDTQTTDYSVKNSSNTIDVVKAAAEACKKYGLHLALYYSLWDRNCKVYRDDEKYVDFMLAQLSELLDGRYGDVVELWLDGAWKKNCAGWGLDRVYDLVKRLQPGCQMGVNHCIGSHEFTGGFANPKFQPVNYTLHDPIAYFPSDFRLFDPHMTNKEGDPKLYTYRGNIYYMPFEATFCSRDGFCWFHSDTYETEFPPHDYMHLAACYKQLMAQENLMVINIPADRNGKLVKSDVENLMKMADEVGTRRTL